MVCERCRQKFSCQADSQSTDLNICWCKSLPQLKPIPAVYKDCLCPTCLRLFASSNPPLVVDDLVEGDDYYLDKGLFVFTEQYHLKKGACCNNNCRHCPYQ